MHVKILEIIGMTQMHPGFYNFRKASIRFPCFQSMNRNLKNRDSIAKLGVHVAKLGLNVSVEYINTN